MVSLSIHLKQARKRAGYTQEQLAEKVGVSRAAIARYEAGEIEPSLKTLMLLSDALNSSTDALLGRERPGSAFPKGEIGTLSPEALEALEHFLRMLKSDKNQ